MLDHLLFSVSVTLRGVCLYFTGRNPGGQQSLTQYRRSQLNENVRYDKPPSSSLTQPPALQPEPMHHSQDFAGTTSADTRWPLGQPVHPTGRTDLAFAKGSLTADLSREQIFSSLDSIMQHTHADGSVSVPVGSARQFAASPFEGTTLSNIDPGGMLQRSHSNLIGHENHMVAHERPRMHNPRYPFWDHVDGHPGTDGPQRFSLDSLQMHNMR